MSDYLKIAAGCYVSRDGRISIERLPDGVWAWSVDCVLYDVATTLRDAKRKADEHKNKTA